MLLLLLPMLAQEEAILQLPMLLGRPQQELTTVVMELPTRMEAPTTV